jgi:serine/threonine protein kinase/uncharacterized protein YecT (DUF1311 family)
MATDTDFPSDLRALEREYELIRELGQGGMAAVYLARKRVSGRLVAIKAIRGRYLDDHDAVLRFAREARTVAGLDHPNIVHTEAIEQIDDRAVAIIMEHIPGGTVRDRLREYGAFGAEDAEAILRDVANALAYAHRRGLVHRDVKPENIFLDVARGRAVLSDFGIARPIDGDGAITLLGAALGTPQYMSPEQIDGEKVDGRSDIYSLGVLGWEMLTGRRPWAGESLYGVIYKQKHEDLPRITSLRPRVPANLLFAIEGALKKDKSQRWQTIDSFLEQLTYNPPPVLAQPYPPGEGPVDNAQTVQFRPATLLADELVDAATAHAGAESAADLPDDVAAPIPAPAPLDATVEPAAFITSDPEPLTIAVTPVDAAEPVDTTRSEPAFSEAFARSVAAGPAAPNARPAFLLTPRRKRTLQALGVLVPITIAATSMFVVLSGSARDAARRAESPTTVTSSAGALAADSISPSPPPTTPSSGMLTAPSPQPGQRVAVTPPANGQPDASPSPEESTATARKRAVARDERAAGSTTAKTQSRASRDTRTGNNRAVAKARPSEPVVDSNVTRPAAATTPTNTDTAVAANTAVDDPFKIPSAPSTSAPPNAGPGWVPSPRCRIAATADQRACLAAYIEIGDGGMNRTFDSLVGELRRIAGTAPGAPDPPAVQRIRVEQRVWLGVRDNECPRQAPPGGGLFWAQAQSECFAEMAAARTDELRDAVRRLSRLSSR